MATLNQKMRDYLNRQGDVHQIELFDAVTNGGVSK